MVVIVSAESATLSVQFVSLLSGLKSVYTETFPLPLSVSLHSITDCCFNPFSTTASYVFRAMSFFTFIVDSLPGVGADEQSCSKRVLHHSWIILTDDLDVSGQETNISCQSVGESRT